MPDNWNVVGYSNDPIPDDPSIVAAQVDHIKAVAADIANQVAALPTDGAIEAVPWQSNTGAPDQFKQVVKKLPGDLDKLRTRYTKVGEAMTTFQATLADAKARARANLTKALSAHNDLQAAQAGVRQMTDFAAQARQQASTQNAAAPPGTPPVQPQPWTGPDFGGQLSAAQSAFNDAKAAIDGAVAQFHHASATAAAAVAAASDDSLKNDTSLWGSIVHGVESAAHWVSQHVPLQAIAGLLGKIAAIASLLSFVPIVGEFALGVAGVLAVGALLCDGISSLNDAYEGDFGWHDAVTLGIDAASVVGVGAAGRLEGAADAAVETAEAASKNAAVADSAARAAAASRTGAESTVAARSAQVSELTTGNWLKVRAARLFGVTGRAEAALSQSSTDLARAQAAEAQALQAARAARVSASTAEATAAQAHLRATIAARANDSLTVGGLTNTAVDEHVGTANPAVAMYRSTTMELHHLGQWSDDPSGQAAQELGHHLQAEPISVSSP